jgi:hypothetical protein
MLSFDVRQRPFTSCLLIFQAYDEGSIPFTRSNDFNDLEDVLKFHKFALAQFQAECEQIAAPSAFQGLP